MIFSEKLAAVVGNLRRQYATMVDRALRVLRQGQSLAVGQAYLENLGDAGLELRHELVVLGPGEAPPTGTAWIVYGPMTVEQEALVLAGAADTDEEFRDRLAQHFAGRLP